MERTYLVDSGVWVVRGVKRERERKLERAERTRHGPLNGTDLLPRRLSDTSRLEKAKAQHSTK